MADTNKKEYTSNLHPKGDLDTTVYPNVKCENIIDKDTITSGYTAGKVPDSSLVQKSLDSLSENLETTKIQVDTNKANIAKNTQDIATNAQNIENLSAVMPTDINVDKSGHVILEHDGTEITGQNKKLQVIESNFKGKIKRTIEELSSYYNITYDYFNSVITFLTKEGKNGSYGNKFSTIIFNSTNHSNQSGSPSFSITYKDKNSPIAAHDEVLYFSISRYDRNNNIETFTYIFPEKSGTLALTSDLATKQDKRFTHTVEIHYASNGSYFCFTGTSDKNTPIDSVQDLTTVFANRDLCGVGIFGSAGLSKIHVGSSVNDTTFKKYMTNGEYTNPSEETFAMVFNTTGFTITDSVSAL